MSTQQATEAIERGPGLIRRPTAILALLTALNLLNYLDRFVMSAVLPKVQDDLHLSNALGGSLATIFLVGYFATSPFFGTMADRAGTGGRKRLLMIGVTVWSLATVASGLVRGLTSLIAARACVGVGEASYATIAPTLIDDLATPAKKSRWMAIFFAAIPVGSALGYIVGGAVESGHGWRSSFFVAGGPGIVLAFLCLLIAEPRRRPSVAAKAVGAAQMLFRIPLYRSGVLGFCAYIAAIGGFAYWAPKYIVIRYGLEAGRASATFGLCTVVSGVVGTLSGGWLADIAVRRSTRTIPDGAFHAKETDAATGRANLLVCALSAGLGAVLSAITSAAATPQAFFAWLLPCEVALFLSTGPVNVALLRSTPPGLRASAIALSIFASHLLGDLWSPPLIGLTADHASWTLAMMIAPLGFAIAAIVWGRGAFLPSDRLT